MGLKAVSNLGAGGVPSTTFANFPPASSVPAGTLYFATDVGGGSLWESDGTTWDPTVHQSPYYFFQGFAGNQISGDTTFYDISNSNNNALGQASNTALFTTAGYASTVATTAAAGFILPSLNFDYVGGETFIFWCLQKTTAPVSNVTYAGDGFGSSHPGVRVRANSGGTFDFSLSGSGTSAFSSTSSPATPFDGTLHSFGFVIRGDLREYQLWVDEVVDSAIGGGDYTSFGAGATIDTRTATAFGIGNTPFSSTDTIATEIRSLALFRMPANVTVPLVSQVTSLFQKLRANSARIITNTEF